MNCQVGKEKFGKFIDLAIRILIVSKIWMFKV